MFARYPSALLELFVLLQQHAICAACAPTTMRAVARHLWLIDEEFRQNPRHHRLFLEILRAPEGVTHELRRMNTYGVLGRYIPAFGRIVGRMQYDLFHAYTVDAHTLFVVSNLRRLAMPKFDHELPRSPASCSSCRSPRSPTWRRCSMTSPRAWRRSLGTRFGGCRGLLPGAGAVAL
jgi:[protein-PII] uridylyltransferase